MTRSILLTVLPYLSSASLSPKQPAEMLTYHERSTLAILDYSLYLIGFAMTEQERTAAMLAMDNCHVPARRSQLTNHQHELLLQSSAFVGSPYAVMDHNQYVH